ncbi:NAD(P)-dependent oxidoreductase [Rhabdaerophilum sp. SD176]|uniref:NAD(P)-dependent oxidoreductase n=1 Tax=Rhabdaerophilum sp. SD176 TaxID=2983548 RepID=UPI0024DFE322|nr:NAD(P)-dependent oxidoreductase [Rhabdaerophilum sp. SD176]
MGQERVGFIGVGFMGHGMAKNIVTKGYPLTIVGNRNRAPVESLVAKGAVEVKTAAEVARNSDILHLCLSDSPLIEKIMRAPDGIMAGAHKGLVIVDTSTANPVSTEALAAELKTMGVDFVDAPLGGTPVQAEAGQLVAMCGGEEAVFNRVKPVIETWAAKIIHLGPVGAGHKMKLLNNFVSMGYAAIYAEALALGQKVGISIATFDSVIRGGRMSCGFYETFMGYALEGNPESHKFTLANAFKDLRYVDAMANAAQVPNPIGSAAKNLLGQAIGAGMGQKFVPMLADFVAEQNGIKKG